MGRKSGRPEETRDAAIRAAGEPADVETIVAMVCPRGSRKYLQGIPAFPAVGAGSDRVGSRLRLCRIKMIMP